MYYSCAALETRELREMSSKFRRQFKVCLIGDGFVGKTSIRREYLKEGFTASYLPTLGVDFAQKALDFKGIATNLVIWDIAGQPAFQSLRKRYYEGSSGLILVYSVVDRDSFDSASRWLVEAHDFMKELPPMIVAANKIDLRAIHPVEETVTTEEGKEFAEKFSQMLNVPVVFLETSALRGENIEEVFTELTRMMLGQDAQEEKVEQEIVPEQAESIVKESSSEVDTVTLLTKDSEYQKEEQIARAMNELVQLRAELKVAEEELASTVSRLETKLLTLKNTVRVKQIMYEHLQQELQQTRDEWSKAYDEYMVLNKQKKDEIAVRTKQLEEIMKRIDNVGRIVRTRVGDLDMKKIAQ